VAPSLSDSSDTKCRPCRFASARFSLHGVRRKRWWQAQMGGGGKALLHLTGRKMRTSGKERLFQGAAAKA
jgi:hypothetical protein